MALSQRVRDLLPDALVRGLRSLRPGGRIRFTGPYPSWEAASAASTGYDAGAILAKVRDAALAVRRGEAAFERDSVAFLKPEPLEPHLGILRRIARANSGQLSVLDFGGSLGSLYFQCRPFLAEISRLRWSVVEQPAFVACGSRELADEALRFFATVEESAAAEPPQVAILSSVLQYLPDPAAVARAIAAAGPAAILIDRTPVHDRAEDAILVQHVPPSIYQASYPFRVFGRDRLAALFGERYVLTAELPRLPFETLEREWHARYAGLLMERR